MLRAKLKASLEGTLIVVTKTRLIRQVDAVGVIGGCPDGTAYGPGQAQCRPSSTGLMESGSVSWAQVEDIVTEMPFALHGLLPFGPMVKPKEVVCLRVPAPLANLGGTKRTLPAMMMIPVKDAAAAAAIMKAAKSGTAEAVPAVPIEQAEVMVRT